jgi:hypothetical protein
VEAVPTEGPTALPNVASIQSEYFIEMDTRVVGMSSQDDGTTIDTARTRRDVLAATGSGTAIGGLAGCSSDGGGTATTASDQRGTAATSGGGTGTGALDDGYGSVSPMVVDASYGGADDIGEALTNARQDNPNVKFFRVAPGRYEMTTSADFSRNIGREFNDAERGFKSGWLDLRGVQIHGKTDGDPMFDFVGSRQVRVIGGWLQGRGSTPPSVGILQGRPDASPTNSGHHNYYGTRIRGTFGTAPYYNFAGEENVYVGVEFVGDNSPGAIHTADNHENVESPHTTMKSGSGSNNGHYYVGGADVWSKSEDAPAALVGRGVRSLKLDNTYVSSAAQAGILIDTTPYACEGVAIKSTRFHHSGAEMTNCIRIQGPNPLRQFAVRDADLWSSGPVVDQAESTPIQGIRYTGNARRREPTGIRGENSGKPPVFRGGLEHGGFLEQSRGWAGTPLASEQSLVIERAEDVVLKGHDLSVNEMAGNSVLIDDGAGSVQTNGGVAVGRGDLSGVAPSQDGEFRRDDGTNFAPGEPAYADTEAGVWRALSDPSGTTVQYGN